MSTEPTLEYPQRWIFDKRDQGSDDWIDGPLVDGGFVRFEQGRTDYGLKPITILAVDSTERSVWLLHDALYNRFRDELQRRPNRKLVPGERIVIEKLADKLKSKKNDREYTGYRVFFPDAPAPDESDLFSLEPPPATEESADAKPEADPPDGDIPF